MCLSPCCQQPLVGSSHPSCWCLLHQAQQGSLSCSCLPPSSSLFWPWPVCLKGRFSCVTTRKQAKSVPVGNLHPLGRSARAHLSTCPPFSQAQVWEGRCWGTDEIPLTRWCQEGKCTRQTSASWVSGEAGKESDSPRNPTQPDLVGMVREFPLFLLLWGKVWHSEPSA